MFRAFVYKANFQVLHIWPKVISTQPVVHDLGATIGIQGPCWTSLVWWRTKLVRGTLARASLARWLCWKLELSCWPWARRASLARWPPRVSRAPVRWARNCRRLEFTRWLCWKLELPRWPRASLVRWARWAPWTPRAPVRWARNCPRLGFTRWLGWKLELPPWPPWPPRASRALVLWARNCPRLEFNRWLCWKLELPRWPLTSLVRWAPWTPRAPVRWARNCWKLELSRWPRALRASLACFSSSLCLSLSTDANASRQSAERAEIGIRVIIPTSMILKGSKQGQNNEMAKISPGLSIPASNIRLLKL